MAHGPFYPLHYFKLFHCSFVILNNNNNNKMGFRKSNWILVNLVPMLIYLQKEQGNKLDVPVGTELVTSCLQSQHFLHE